MKELIYLRIYYWQKDKKTKLRNSWIQSGDCLVSLLDKTAGGPLMNVAVSLANDSLPSLGITSAAIDAGIQKKIDGSGTLIISNEEMNDIIKTIQALHHSNILLKGITKAIENKAKEQKGREIISAGYGNKQGKRILRAGYGSKNFNSASFFDKYWNTKVLSEWI